MKLFSDKDLHKICAITNFDPVRIQYKTWLLLLLFVCYSHSQTAQTNIDIIEREVIAVWDSLCSLSLPDSAVMIIDTEMITGEKKFFLNTAFLNSMSAKGWKVSSKEGGYQLVVNEFDVIIFYHEQAARLTGFSKKLRRNLEINLKGRLENRKSGKVIGVYQCKRIFAQEFDSKDQNGIEESQYSFSIGRVKTFSRWSRFLEPGIAILSVTAMIYLLFSVRF